jgi:hypothetical protein
MRVATVWLSVLLGFIPTEGGVAFANNNQFRASAGRGHLFGVGSSNGKNPLNVVGGATKSKSKSSSTATAHASKAPGVDVSIQESGTEVRRKCYEKPQCVIF